MPGQVTVSGSGAKWNDTGSPTIGGSGKGTLTIDDCHPERLKVGDLHHENRMIRNPCRSFDVGVPAIDDTMPECGRCKSMIQPESISIRPALTLRIPAIFGRVRIRVERTPQVGPPQFA